MKHVNWFIIHLVLGLWLFISPYVFGFSHVMVASWNAMILGLLLVLSSTFGLYYGQDEVSNDGIKRQADGI